MLKVALRERAKLWTATTNPETITSLHLAVPPTGVERKSG